jgi:hypothetical protein
VRFVGTFVLSASSVVSVAAPVGNGRLDAEIGCVTADPSTTKPLTLVVNFVSMDERLLLPVVCRAEVDAPEGSALERTSTWSSPFASVLSALFVVPSFPKTATESLL